MLDSASHLAMYQLRSVRFIDLSVVAFKVIYIY